MSRRQRAHPHRWREVLSQADAVIGWRCEVAGCRASETASDRRDREAREAERAETRRVRVAEAADRRARAAEVVDWRCECGVARRLPRCRAEARVWCCRSCARRGREGREPLAPCPACGGEKMHPGGDPT